MPGSKLRSVASAAAAASASARERCELCSEPVLSIHRHLLDLESRDLLCACQACALLFDRRESGGRRYRLTPDRRLSLEDFVLDDAAWESLLVPVTVAFFVRSSRTGSVGALYPSPMGPTESEVDEASWKDLVSRNPGLLEMEPDVECLLVRRGPGRGGHWLVPIDDGYRLAGPVRTRWKGLSGGKDLWRAVDDFFDQLDARARSVSWRTAPVAGATGERSR